MPGCGRLLSLLRPFTSKSRSLRLEAPVLPVAPLYNEIPFAQVGAPALPVAPFTSKSHSLRLEAPLSLLHLFTSKSRSIRKRVDRVLCCVPLHRNPVRSGWRRPHSLLRLFTSNFRLLRCRRPHTLLRLFTTKSRSLRLEAAAPSAASLYIEIPFAQGNREPVQPDYRPLGADVLKPLTFEMFASRTYRRNFDGMTVKFVRGLSEAISASYHHIGSSPEREGSRSKAEKRSASGRKPRRGVYPEREGFRSKTEKRSASSSKLSRGLVLSERDFGQKRKKGAHQAASRGGELILSERDFGQKRKKGAQRAASRGGGACPEREGSRSKAEKRSASGRKPRRGVYPEREGFRMKERKRRDGRRSEVPFADESFPGSAEGCRTGIFDYNER